MNWEQFKTYVFLRSFQFFNTIESAYNYAEEEMRQNVLILVHSGTYKAEFLVIDSNVTILGAGEYSFLWCVYTQSECESEMLLRCLS